MIMSIIIPAVLSAFVVVMLGQLEPGKDGKPVPFRKKVEVYTVLVSKDVLSRPEATFGGMHMGENADTPAA